MAGTIRASELGGWTPYQVLQHDAGEHGLYADDGFITSQSLLLHIQNLEVEAPNSTAKAAELDRAKDLYNAMAAADADVVQYLPDSLMHLSESHRRRATALLRSNETSELTPIMIDSYLGVTNHMGPTSMAALSSQGDALQELKDIREALWPSHSEAI